MMTRRMPGAWPMATIVVAVAAISAQLALAWWRPSHPGRDAGLVFAVEQGAVRAA